MRLAVVLLALASRSAAAAPVVVDRALVVGRVEDGVWTDAPTEARLDQHAQLAAIAIGHQGARRVVLVPPGLVALRLGGRTVPVRQLGTLEPTAIRWSATVDVLRWKR